MFVDKELVMIDEEIRKLGDRLANAKSAEEAKQIGKAFDKALHGDEPPSAGGVPSDDKDPQHPPLVAAASKE